MSVQKFQPPDPREEAYQALAIKPRLSINSALSVGSGVIGTIVIIEVGLLAVNKFSWAQVPFASAIAIAAIITAYFFNEFQRLERCKDALDSIIRADKSYEDLLTATRQERDQAKQAADNAAMESDMLRHRLFLVSQMVDDLKSVKTTIESKELRNE